MNKKNSIKSEVEMNFKIMFSFPTDGTININA